MDFNLKKILKALLFSTSEPLSIKDVQAVISRYHSELESSKKKRATAAAESGVEGAGTSEQNFGGEDTDLPADAEQTVIEDIFAQVPTLLTGTQIREAMEEIGAELESSDEVCRLLQSSSGFKLSISKDYAEWVRLLRNDPRPQRLTRAALETLAIVAYRQPVTRAEIEAIRGVGADSALNRLIEKELIFISGRADLPGRPIQYATTQNFLDYVGVNSVEELPASDVLSPNQISEWIRRASSASDIGDKDVGLPQESESEEAEAVKTAEHEEELAYSEQNAEAEASQTGEDREIENAFGEEDREVPLKKGASAFPSDGSESAGSEEEFDNSPDDIDADSRSPNSDDDPRSAF